jgi:mono/diheme cytochrome c family protein
MTPRFHALAIAMLLSGAGASQASGAADARVPTLPAYQQECASCHLAYPPGLLPAASWRRLMNNLPRHFGTDASIDAAALQQLSGWLEANAGTYKKVARDPTPPPQERITRSAWFVREHDEVPAATWARPAIRSAANCAACHTRAEQGEFRERDIRIPR